MRRDGYGTEPDPNGGVCRVWRDGRSPTYQNLPSLRESMKTVDREIVDILTRLAPEELNNLADLLLARGGCAQEGVLFKKDREEVWAPNQRQVNIERSVSFSRELGNNDAKSLIAIEKFFSFIVASCISMQAVAFEDTVLAESSVV